MRLNLISYIASAWERRYHRHYHPRVQHGSKHFIADIAMAGAIILLVLFNGISGFAPLLFAKKSLLLAVRSDQSAFISGKDATFQIVYRNASKTTLENVTIKFVLPHYFTFREILHDNTRLDTPFLTIEKLQEGEEGEIVLKGIPVGSWNETQTIGVRASAERGKEKKSHEFVASLFEYRISGSGFDLRFDLPRKVAPHQTFDGHIILTNTTPYPVAQGIVELRQPKGFLLQSFDHSRESKRVLSLQPNEQKRLTFRGRFLEEHEGEVRFQSRFFIRAGTQPLLQEEKDESLSLRKNAFSFIITPDNGKQSINPGEIKKMRFVWKSKSEEELSHVIVGVKLKGDYFKKESIRTFDGFVSSDDTVVWSKNSRKDLETVHEGYSGFGEFSFAAHEILNLSTISPDHDFDSILQPFASYTYSDGSRIESIGEPVKLSVSSKLSIVVFARYFTPEGEQIGRGPLPPRVGKSTKYQLFMSIGNTIHPLSNVSVRAKIGRAATWSGDIPMDEKDTLTFDTNTAQVLWSPKNVAPGIGKHNEQKSITFALTLTPTLSDRGTVPLLLKDIRVTGVDTITGDVLMARAPIITTDLRTDEKARDKGRVVNAL